MASSRTYTPDLLPETALPEALAEQGLYKPANSFDLKDWALMESVLAGKLTVDYSDLRGDPPKEITAREYAQARREALEALDTQHIIGNLEITVDADWASVEASSMIFRTLDGVVFNTHARYHFRVSKQKGRVWSQGRRDFVPRGRSKTEVVSFV